MSLERCVQYTDRNKRIALAGPVRSVQEFASNCENFASSAEGSTEERKQFRNLLKNNKYFVFLSEGSRNIFCPVRIAAYNTKEYSLSTKLWSTQDAKTIGNNILGPYIKSGTRQHTKLDKLYVEYCNFHQVIPSKHRTERRYFHLDYIETKSNHKFSIRKLAVSINEFAHSYEIKDLQKFRKKNQNLRKIRSGIIFDNTTISDGGQYAFHYGGRTELQFNIGVDGHDADKVRYGVAFSLRASRSLPDISLLYPKIRRFNDFIQTNFETVGDLQMWIQKGEGDFSITTPHTVSPTDIAENVFIFLGCISDKSSISAHKILTLFDRLIPLYKYTENPFESVHTQTPNEQFIFRPGFYSRVDTAIRNTDPRSVDIIMRHNLLQARLIENLVKIHGTENVAGEQSTSRGTFIDAVLKVDKGFHFYEIKTFQSVRSCIRLAIGQLLEYAKWPESLDVTRLIICGEPPLEEDASAYLENLRRNHNLPIYYEQLSID